MATETTNLVLCADCGREAPHNARGLCRACYKRHERYGNLHRWPRLGVKREFIYRREDFNEMRSWGLSVREAAERLGVNHNTALRYERARLAGGDE